MSIIFFGVNTKERIGDFENCNKLLVEKVALLLYFTLGLGAFELM